MSLEKLAACPVCRGTVFRPHLKCKDFTTSGELFHVEQCEGCLLLLTNPRPTQSDSGRYYKSDSYISHQSVPSSLIDHIYLIIRRFTLRWKYSLIKPSIQANSLLDYGCGTGAFLQYCQKLGVNTTGIEPSEEARQLCKANGLAVYDSLSNLPQQTFGAITLWHVLEHVYSLADTLSKLKDSLAENGTIFIAVPNWQSPDGTRYREDWAGYDVPRHVWHFSKQSMATLLETSGLKLREVIPMKLDSYYVSILSEKYKTHGRLTVPGLTRALLSGWRSNLEARRNTNHSSLIYVVQK